MFRYSNDWLETEEKYKDLANADLDIEGISIGAKYSFLNKKFKFAAMKNLKKSDPNFEVDHEFEISYDHNENDNIKLKYEDKTFGTELECDIWSSENKNHRLGLYKNTKIGSDFSLATTLQLLYGFGSNYFFHFGLRKLGLFGNESDEVCKLRQPNFSFGGLYRFVKNDNLDGSVGLNVDLKQTSVEKVRPMLSLRSGNFATLLNLSLEPLSGSYKTGADLGIETQVSDDLNVYGHFKVDHTPAQGKEDAVLSNEFTVGAAYRFDKATELRLNFNSNISASFGIFKKFSNFINFAFIANFAKDEKSNIFNNKFGLAFEFEENEE